MNFDARVTTEMPRPLDGFGNASVTVTNHMLLENGRPVVPVMGECHYSRIPRARWRRTLELMKAGGVTIVASYVFWIHHEEHKGVFDFDGNRDIRAFIRLCNEMDLGFCLRIGPWAHGECRNGGFPDWLCRECADSLRSAQEPYFSYVRRFYEKIAEQVKGLPLAGIQIENEMTGAPDYMEKLRRIVRDDLHLEAPLWTATGWGSARLPETLLPMFGGYPEAPWEQHTQPLAENPNYFFSRKREDGKIGIDLLGTAQETSDDGTGRFPFMTCEVGGGNQVTYHRRPLIAPRDIEALALCKIGSGAKLLGYYVYKGGINPIGETTMQESRAAGYPNDCPVCSYDFQAPIGDMGQLRESYFTLGYLHTFLREYGDLLAPMHLSMPDTVPASLADTETLRCAVQTNGRGGFLFVNNYHRLASLPAHPAEPFRITFADRTVSFALDVPGNSCFFLPVGLKLGTLSVRYLTAQPVCRTEGEHPHLTFLRIPGVEPVLVLEDGRAVVLQDGAQEIDGTELLLIRTTLPAKSPLRPLAVTETAPVHDAALLFGHLGLPDLSREYRVTWDDDAKYLVIEAEGNVAGFYDADGRLVSDWYIDGDKWVIDLSVLESDRKEGFLKIQPLRPEDAAQIYFEMTPSFACKAPAVYASDCDTLIL